MLRHLKAPEYDVGTGRSQRATGKEKEILGVGKERVCKLVCMCGRACVWVWKGCDCAMRMACVDVTQVHW